MNNILEKIVFHKKKEITLNKKTNPITLLEKSNYFNCKVKSFSKALSNSKKINIIAEFKRYSPSKKYINKTTNSKQICTNYEKNGAAAISILTDNLFFKGNKEHLINTRDFINIPILRKDFIIDPYQIIEAKSMGADVILLIASILNPQQCYALAKFAQSLGLETFLEVHTKKEVTSHLNEYINVIGINNRDLKTFKVDLKNSINISKTLPKNSIRVSESGIKTPTDIAFLKENGFNNFLMGESFMKTQNPPKALRLFLTKSKQLCT